MIFGLIAEMSCGDLCDDDDDDVTYVDLTNVKQREGEKRKERNERRRMLFDFCLLILL
jgi:hypothetical protein